MLFVLLKGALSFAADNMDLMFDKIKEGDYSLPPQLPIPPTELDQIAHHLQRRPSLMCTGLPDTHGSRPRPQGSRATRGASWRPNSLQTCWVLQIGAPCTLYRECVSKMLRWKAPRVLATVTQPPDLVLCRGRYSKEFLSL